MPSDNRARTLCSGTKCEHGLKTVERITYRRQQKHVNMWNLTWSRGRRALACDFKYFILKMLSGRGHDFEKFTTVALLLWETTKTIELRAKLRIGCKDIRNTETVLVCLSSLVAFNKWTACWYLVAVFGAATPAPRQGAADHRRHGRGRPDRRRPALQTRWPPGGVRWRQRRRSRRGTQGAVRASVTTMLWDLKHRGARVPVCASLRARSTFVSNSNTSAPLTPLQGVVICQFICSVLLYRCCVVNI